MLPCILMTLQQIPLQSILKFCAMVWGCRQTFLVVRSVREGGSQRCSLKHGLSQGWEPSSQVQGGNPRTEAKILTGSRFREVNWVKVQGPERNPETESKTWSGSVPGNRVSRCQIQGNAHKLKSKNRAQQGQ